MVEAYITGVILFGAACVVGLLLHITPERWLNVLWQKLHLDNDEPYSDIDED